MDKARWIGARPVTRVYKGNETPRPVRLVCKAGHVLAEHGYPISNGSGATFIRCRVCHTKRAREYKEERKRMTGERP